MKTKDFNNYNGLNTCGEKTVEEMQSRYGLNYKPEPKPPTMLKRILGKLNDFIMQVLLALAFLLGIKSIFIDHELPFEFFNIVTILAINIGANIKSDLNTEKKYRELKDRIPIAKVKVIRNGNLQTILASELVVGDKIILESGEQVYADCILIDGNLSICNSALNGEPDEYKMFPDNDYDIDFDHDFSGETFNTYFINSGAIITQGQATAIVVRVGEKTISGSALNNVKNEQEEPLTIKLENLVIGISKFGYIISGAIFLGDMFARVLANDGIVNYLSKGFGIVGLDMLGAIMFALAVVSASVPEGLPLSKTIVLSNNVGKMEKHNVLLKNIAKGETNGSISHLFSDKTGTITKGELQVVEALGGDLAEINLTDNSIRSNMTIVSIAKNTVSDFDMNGIVVGGNFTDQSFLRWIGLDNFKNCKQKILEQQIFNSSNKYSASQIEDSKGILTIYKGASEKLLNYATKCVDKDGNIINFNKEKALAKIDELANRAMRTLAFGYSLKPLVKDEINDDFVLIGIVGIRDEVRDSSKRAIATLAKAGVKVTMITGDKKETATAIARECGLIDGGLFAHINGVTEDLILTNDELENMTDEEIKIVLPNIRVIARAMPEMKRRIACLAQELGEVVGMTGDGVNDAPALKQADVGYAMGSGTDVAKEAGDVIIVDDNLESIVYALQSGRTVYKNIQKFLKFQLTINIGITVVSCISAWLGLGEVLSVMQILWINAIMDTFAGLAYSSEPSEDSYMKEMPIDREANVIDVDMKESLIISGGYSILASLLFLLNPSIKSFFGEAHLTGYFAMFVFIALFNSLNVRTHTLNLFNRLKENKDFIYIMGGITIAQILLVQLGGKLFNCIPLNLHQWFVIIIASILILPIDLIRKTIVRILHK